ncbi:MAG: hypothetical protein VKI82_00515, partial [Leptolyngbya sp.]|nr:hypothetical protein [Leptolyngbya sp.]
SDGVTPDGVTPETSPPAADHPDLPPPTPPAAEVWTELDEAEPAAVSGSAVSGSAVSESEVKKGEEPDPTVLDAGPGAHQKAEKPGRPVLPYDDWEPSEVPYQPKELGVIDQIMVVLAEGAKIWRKLLRQVRSWLPQPWQRNLSDDLMTALALGLLIFGLVLWNPLGGRGTTSPVAVEDPSVPGPVIAPGRDQLDYEGSRRPATEPPSEALEPSPEQRLIADIQDRVSTISRSYAVGLIQSVEVNLPQQVIAINVGNDWYGLERESQDRIAQDIYAQAQGLAFATLQLRDPDGAVVARNPVVGPSMVILKRQRPGDPVG